MEYLIGYLIAALISFAILYLVVRAAVLHALISHYKTVRLFERTGEWQSGPHGTGEPRKLD
jgi:hypothetical protein